MLYRCYPQAVSERLCRRPCIGSNLPYHTVKEMRKLYPDSSFAVIGEIGGIARFPCSGDRLITEAGNAIPIFPRGSLKKPFEWISGYIAVIGGLLPSFLRR